jgi:ATP-dependent protease HslVU (ClpYQ) ATPase subunit
MFRAVQRFLPLIEGTTVSTSTAGEDRPSCSSRRAFHLSKPSDLAELQGRASGRAFASRVTISVS